MSAKYYIYQKLGLWICEASLDDAIPFKGYGFGSTREASIKDADSELVVIRARLGSKTEIPDSELL